MDTALSAGGVTRAAKHYPPQRSGSG